MRCQLPKHKAPRSRKLAVERMNVIQLCTTAEIMGSSSDSSDLQRNVASTANTRACSHRHVQTVAHHRTESFSNKTGKITLTKDGYPWYPCWCYCCWLLLRRSNYKSFRMTERLQNVDSVCVDKKPLPGPISQPAHQACMICITLW